jgi:light-regulated signal transduction histidine kinase (bacteriophytochrome)
MLNGSDKNIPLPPSVLNQRFTRKVSGGSFLQHTSAPIIMKLTIVLSDEEKRTYHRRQNHYAKIVEGLQRSLNVQRLIHNWVRPHWGLQKNQTPAMAMGYEFSATDNGLGIAPEYHDKIFMIFQSGNPQNSIDSSGVGLSIVKKIVELEEGTIWFETQQNQGTKFYFT